MFVRAMDGSPPPSTVQAGSKLMLSTPMTVFVNKVPQVKVMPHNAIAELKRKVAAATHMAIASQVLYFNGRHLSDAKYLCSYNMGPNAEVRLTSTLGGGMKRSICSNVVPSKVRRTLDDSEGSIEVSSDADIPCDRAEGPPSEAECVTATRQDIWERLVLTFDDVLDNPDVLEESLIVNVESAYEVVLFNSFIDNIAAIPGALGDDKRREVILTSLRNAATSARSRLTPSSSSAAAVNYPTSAASMVP
eukprot:TRINITY_DN24753_c0_g1_i1.p1 TRINITY_DN24753_c0_g1~~TRINITY_DN24753_c0_g1_i1.p1  ORF type:complete len:266 (-),score=61.57 TRINITY_DN24753_c0_g1_i1:24-767(-)